MDEKMPDQAREKMAARTAANRADAGAGTPPRVKWNDADMRTSYANVCNVAGTREEVTLLFGTHQNWHSAQTEVSVRLSERVILSPYAAKRLARLLTGVVAEYEKRFGPLGLDQPEGTLH